MKNKILIIGEENFVMDLQSKFWKTDFDVSGAKASRIALERVKEFEFEIIIIQDEYSEIDSFELCHQLKSFSRHHYHIFIALNIDNETLINQYIKSGADDFISKDFQLKELFLRLKTHLQMISRQQIIIESNKKKAIQYAILAQKKNQKMVNLKESAHDEITAGDFLKNVFHQLTFGIFILDEVNRIVIENSKANQFFGKVSGKNAHDFFNSSDFQHFEKKFNIDNLSNTENFKIKYGVRIYGIREIPILKVSKNISRILLIEDLSENKINNSYTDLI